MLAATLATPTVQATLMTAEAANCHQDTAPRPTRVGMDGDAVRSSLTRSPSWRSCIPASR